jgi:uncharacterized SAM-binding protein YcdF (DUF218 family)
VKLNLKFLLLGFLGAIILLTFIFTAEAKKILSQNLNSWTEDPVADCAVVLTGGPNRIREGFDLLSHRSVHKLVISGVNPATDLKEIFPLWAYYPEVHEQDVVLERRSRSTFGNAQQSLPILQALRCRDVILVTARIHMYRSLRTFHSEFPTSLKIIPRAVVGSSLDPSPYDLGLEMIKSIFYSVWAY